MLISNKLIMSVLITFNINISSVWKDMRVIIYDSFWGVN